jgi:uncharacterized protein
MKHTGQVESPDRLDGEGGEAAVRPVLFYLLAFAIAWVAWAPLLLHKLEILRLPIPFPITLFVGQSLGAFAPLLSLLAIGRITNDPTLVTQVFSRLRFKELPVYMGVMAALTPIAITVLITVFVGLISRGGIIVLQPEPLEELGWGLLAVIPLQFVLGMIGSPLGEEPGWRGYILERFARRGRALSASVFVAALWWIWHLPLFVVLGVDLNGYMFLVMAAHSLLIDSFFLLTRHNLLVAMLYHQGVNTSFLFLISKADSPGGSIVLLLIAVIARMWVHKNYMPLRSG